MTDVLDTQMNSDLIRGHIDTMILSVLLRKDDYGYNIMKEISRRSGHTFEMKEPTLYASLRRLVKQELVESYWGEESQGGRRKYYRMTQEGLNVYRSNLEEWEAAKLLIDRLIADEEEGSEAR